MKAKATKNGKSAAKVVGKTIKASKPPTKPQINAQKKPQTKSLTKKQVKPPVKSAPKAVVKVTAKPAVKAPAKVVRQPVNVAAKPSVKKPAAPATNSKSMLKKPLAKPTSKSATQTTTKKPVPKVIVKVPPKVNVKTAVKKAPAAMPKPAVKTTVKTLVKAAPKVAAKPAPKSKVVTPPVKIKPQPAAGKKLEKTVVPPVVVAPVAVVKPAVYNNGLPPPPPLKPGRRSSSRALAHMPPPAPMVPTHAPDAAKASYSTMTERVIAPPPHVAAKKDPKLANNWKSKTPDTLTDEEVKAMPDAEYMNDMQMAFFRHRLSILKQDIHNSAGATTEHLREDTTVVPDPADRATIEEEHALELRTRDRERKLLKKIEQSIGRIDSGDYGYCDETGEPIGVGRLIARPTASLSLEAQQRRELKQKMFGD